MRIKKKLVEEVYQCPNCENIYTVWRKSSQQRKKEHLKWLFCYRCNKNRNFAKILGS